MTILANGLDDRYITGPELQDYFVDKSTGQPLAFGQIFFYQDTSRTTPKNVYQLTYDSGTNQYSYTALPNPLTLSATGTFDDGNGVNIPIYYFPYDEFDNLELYYVAAYDSNNLLQFTRDAWPYPNASTSAASTINDAIGLTNMLTNPQFAVVNFIAGSTLTIPYTIGSTTVNIAPGWDLVITASGSGTLTVAQTPVAGSAAYPFNPPFVLTITPGLNIFSGGLRLLQSFPHNPDWAAPQTTGEAGFLSGSVMLGPGTSVIMSYIPSAGNPNQIIIDDTNATGSRKQFNATIQLDAAGNPSDGLTGSDTIELSLSNTSPSEIGNIQVIPLSTNVALTGFDQTPVNRQIDQMFNYYKALLDFKPIPSYLVGWDFPLNPAQFGSTITTFASGVNKSNYFWDQTIIFQSANSGVSAARGTDGSLVLTAAATTKLALIQYLEVPREILTSYLACNVRAFTNNGDAVPGTISLWYTTDAQLPNVAAGTNNSLVLTLDANGKPATFNGNWTEVPRSNLGDALFSLSSGATTYSDYGFANWLAADGSTTATYFAIVVGTGSITSGSTLTVQSISCVPGQIATRPAPQTISSVLHDCNRYYWDTFPVNIAAGDNKGNTGALGYTVQITGTPAGYTIPVVFPAQMRVAPTPFFYNPSSGTAGKWRNIGAPADSGVAAVSGTIGVEAVNINNPQVAVTDVAGNAVLVHAAFEARLGIVL